MKASTTMPKPPATTMAALSEVMKTLSRLAETMFAVVESGHPDACVLPDIYHLYKGGSSFDSLKLLGGKGVHVFHVNDYPADPPREKITDADRIYPGDGVAPLVTKTIALPVLPVADIVAEPRVVCFTLE